MVSSRLRSRSGLALGVIAGFMFFVPIIALPALSVAPASGHPVGAIADFDRDGRLDLQLQDGTVLHGDGQGGFTGNTAVVTDTGVVPDSYALANGTPAPSDKVSRFVNTSYILGSGAGTGALIVITPYNENVTVFAPDSSGEYRPVLTIDLRSASLRELSIRPAPEKELGPVPEPEDGAVLYPAPEAAAIPTPCTAP